MGRVRFTERICHEDAGDAVPDCSNDRDGGTPGNATWQVRVPSPVRYGSTCANPACAVGGRGIGECGMHSMCGHGTCPVRIAGDSYGESDMSFTSLWYFPFLVVIAGLCHVLSGRPRRYLLLAASWWMYGCYGLTDLLLLATVTLITYLAGRGAQSGSRGRTVAAAAGIVTVAGILLYYKSYDTTPIGISFYTFQSIAYVVDVYRGQSPERSLPRYTLFLSFFPQLVAGPIEHAQDLLPQLETGRADREDIATGIRYLLSGCVRKFVIADYMAGYVDAAYADVADSSGVALLLATILFAVQIYCDFSGYTHIAIGSGRLLGIRLTENFNRPYLARGCRDFWSRWHITLTRWLTEYIYIPLGGNRRGVYRKYLNILVVFLVSGLWHGTDMTFVLWGAFYGIWRIAEERTGIRTGRIVTFCLVCLSWILFRSRNVAEACLVMKSILTLADGTGLSMNVTELCGIALRIGILVLLPRLTPEVSGGERGALGNTALRESIPKYYVETVLALLITVCMLAGFANGGDSSFIYFQF